MFVNPVTALSVHICLDCTWAFAVSDTTGFIAPALMADKATRSGLVPPSTVMVRGSDAGAGAAVASNDDALSGASMKEFFRSFLLVTGSWEEESQSAASDPSSW